MNFFKRTMPLLITASVGFVLIVASFLPATVDWSEIALVWFDILAAVAFILGGGNLLKVQLKKISDHSAGWGYAFVTLIAFVVTLVVGLFKIGSQPAAKQEFYGQVFAALPLEELPESLTFRVPGAIPHREFDAELPASVRRQLSEENGEIVFRGWINGDQIKDLKKYNTTLKWLCTLENLEKKAALPDSLKGHVAYLVDHESLSFEGAMTKEQKEALLGMKGGSEAWKTAVNQLSELSTKTVTQDVKPPNDFAIPESLSKNDRLTFKKDAGTQETGTLTLTGSLSPGDRDALVEQFPVVVPLSSQQRDAFRREIESRGEPFTDLQLEAFNKVLDGLWTPEQLITAINAGGVYKEKEKTACELLALNGKEPPEEEKQPDAKLNPDQEAVLNGQIESAPPTELVAQLTEKLEAAGELTAGHKAALAKFFKTQPTIGQRNRALYFALLNLQALAGPQKDFLLAAVEAEAQWQKQIVELFQKAHQVKYPWSGDYREQGTPFWWIYEYLFKPLTATMFALLAFYVASAAFRAFRAKNLEATLLLATAFIILLGRTFAGVLLTSWVPESLSGLKIENLAVYIMQVFNTAGNRAIMIGIALGIASTSLKVLLGIDRSYLGSQED